MCVCAHLLRVPAPSCSRTAADEGARRATCADSLADHEQFRQHPHRALPGQGEGTGDVLAVQADGERRELHPRSELIEPRLEALRPGDILGFSVEGDRVTHVGLYVGDGRFIHSASDGVKLSSLAAPDGDSQWWRRHWIVARRILQ